MRSVFSRAKTALLAASLTGLAMPAFASGDTPAMGWHIALRSGFDLTCARIDPRGDKMRVYLHAAGDDFVDIKAADILATEQVELPPDSVSADVTQRNLPMPVDRIAVPLDIAALTTDAGQQVNLDSDLIASIIHAESAGNPRAVSRTGARGLMQLMPGTAGQLGVRDAFNPAQNVTGGTAYFNQLLLLYHDNLALALAAYNAGPGAVAKYHGVPPYRETQAYVRRVITEFNRRKKISRSASQSTKSAAVFADKATPTNLMLASAAAK